MKIGNLQNPYKAKGNEQPVRVVLASVGQEDYERLYLCHPFRGLQDTVISHLFAAFVKELNNRNVPTHYEPSNATVIEDILRGITFGRPS